ncbi:hypothetical protein MAR_005751 [Mya arenaria]|uniref:Uncharacterized protein n=1 Tax=Mya arenaria TaxID=6604 RepID=A0ABY7F3L6_MYAAR|nr:hypothetical protein MAR_005751 [Mya arenaria]
MAVADCDALPGGVPIPTSPCDNCDSGGNGLMRVFNAGLPRTKTRSLKLMCGIVAEPVNSSTSSSSNETATNAGMITKKSFRTFLPTDDMVNDKALLKSQIDMISMWCKLII